ncbi:Uncharacterised protein [Weissella viridescens]|uniref:Uncharacterized protein n=1 Tax=Weissella viridescens TaxID=1629 RepID=A0A380P6T8_WEIVI|nr:Uncharacterised protein [Weissella viridescens]
MGDLDVESFAVSHDAVDPQFYAFHHDNKTFAMLTDTGYMNDRSRSMLANADTILMEAIMTMICCAWEAMLGH